LLAANLFRDNSSELQFSEQFAPLPSMPQLRGSRQPAVVFSCSAQQAVALVLAAAASALSCSCMASEKILTSS
jgi:hypothetical protein